ncbi:hypothetical protein FBF35_07625 [Schaalia odontolytica]|uniref:hypothetical protein n=1 Tax=Schaalia odontolytica TaxID=1660 RepID=UPI0010FBC339|nr:hypothetical protein [Schaalia odontolytica]QCT35891.1 hypothetical protein FBF35_07625 [Schaalia odontolytica]
MFSNAFDWISEHKDLLVALGEGIGIAVAAYWGFSVLTQVIEWIKNTTLVQEGLNAAMAANPIGLAVVAIGALIAGLIYLYNTTRTSRTRSTPRLWHRRILDEQRHAGNRRVRRLYEEHAHPGYRVGVGHPHHGQLRR